MDNKENPLQLGNRIGHRYNETISCVWSWKWNIRGNKSLFAIVICLACPLLSVTITMHKVLNWVKRLVLKYYRSHLTDRLPRILHSQNKYVCTWYESISTQSYAHTHSYLDIWHWLSLFSIWTTVSLSLMFSLHTHTGSVHPDDPAPYAIGVSIEQSI